MLYARLAPSGAHASRSHDTAQRGFRLNFFNVPSGVPSLSVQIDFGGPSGPPEYLPTFQLAGSKPARHLIWYGWGPVCPCGCITMTHRLLW